MRTGHIQRVLSPLTIAAGLNSIESPKRADTNDKVPVAVKPPSKKTVPLTFIPSAASVLPLLSVPVSSALRQVSWPAMSALDQSERSGGAEPVVQGYAAADVYSVGDECVTCIIPSLQLSAAEGEWPADVRARQLDGTGSGEYLREENTAYDLHPVGTQRVTFCITAGQSRAPAGELAGDVGVQHSDSPGCDEPSKKRPIPDFHPVSDQRIAVAIAAAQLCVLTAELAGDIRAHQPNRPASGDHVVKEHPLASLQSVAHQRIAITASARQLGAAADKRSADVCPDHPDRPGIAVHPSSKNTSVSAFMPLATSALPSRSRPVSWAPPHSRWPVMFAFSSRTAPAAVKPLLRNTPLLAFNQSAISALPSLSHQVSWAPLQLSWPVISASDQPDRPCSGEPHVEEHSSGGFQPVSD